jgi:hypothetical protein
MEDMKKEIQKALSRPVCSGWDRGFLESVLSQLERGRDLSEKQLVTVTKVALRNGEEAQKIHYEWEDIYNKEHKEEALVLARYYKTTGYFAELTRDILADIVPDMRAYTKMRGNKYAQKVLKSYYAEPKYINGAFVAPRASTVTADIGLGDIADGALNYASARSFKEKGGFVLYVVDEIRSAASGSKIYKILPVGSAIPVFVEERRIKLKRK